LKKVLITTDIGGSDPDDIQSLIHAMFYTDMIDLQGIVCGCKNGDVKAAQAVINKYARDYEKLKAAFPGLTPPNELFNMVHQGRKEPWQKALAGTAGSRAIIRATRGAGYSEEYLYILAWGSLTDTAQALYDDPSIAHHIFIYAISGWNHTQDPIAFEYVTKNPKVRCIVAHETFRGMYITGVNNYGKYGNVPFVKDTIRKSGNLGKYFYEISREIGVNRYGIKMGDTPSLLWMLNGEQDPVKASWGGRFIQTGPNKWGDRQDESLKLGDYHGAKTVAKHRLAFLKHWEERLKVLW